MVEEEVPEGEDPIKTSRVLALECHRAWDDYRNLLKDPEFTQASNLPRGGGAEQAESGTASEPSRETPREAPEPAGPGPGTITEGQLEAIATLSARSEQTEEFLRQALVNLKAEKVEQISTEAAAAIIGKLNSLGPETSEA